MTIDDKSDVDFILFTDYMSFNLFSGVCSGLGLGSWLKIVCWSKRINVGDDLKKI